jgi:hypothetical protein
MKKPKNTKSYTNTLEPTVQKENNKDTEKAIKSAYLSENRSMNDQHIYKSEIASVIGSRTA